MQLAVLAYLVAELLSGAVSASSLRRPAGKRAVNTYIDSHSIARALSITLRAGL